MKPRAFEFRMNSPRGFPGMLAVGLIAILLIGVVGLLVVMGAAVLVAGLAISACAALYYAVRRKLGMAAPRAEPRFEQPAAASSVITEVREIEVEVLSRKES